MKNRAFTLAEVLITLGIIGVVAAITMPVLIGNYQKVVLRQQFRKFYSTFSQALNQVRNDNGMTVPDCYYTANGQELKNTIASASCADTYEQIFTKLKVIKICQGNAYSDGCIPDYNGIETVGHTSGVSGFTTETMKNTSWVYVLADGTILIPYRMYNNFYSLFTADINGKRGPNKWGYDLFAFAIVTDMATRTKYYLIGVSYAVAAGGIRTPNMIKSEMSK